MASSPIVFRKHLSSYIYTNDGVISRGNGKRLLHEFDDSELHRDLALGEEKILGTVGCVRSGETFGGRKTFRQVREREPRSLGAPQRNSRCVFFDPAYNLCVARLLFGGDLMAISESISPPSLCMPTNQTGRVRFFLVSFLPLSLIPISRSAQTRFLSSLVYTRISIILKLVPV